MVTLAKTMFSTGPDDSLGTVDIYNKNNSTVINNRPNIEEFIDSDLTKSFVANEKIIDELKIIVGNDQSGLKIDKEALISGVLATSSGVMGAFRSLPEAMRNELTKVDGNNKIQMTLNGVEKYLDKANLSTISNLALMIKGISGCSFPLQLQDKHGISILGTNLIKQSSKLGLFDSYHAFIECLADKYIGKKITKNLIPYITGNSDFNLLKSVANGPFAKDVINDYPNVINTFSSSFKLPKNKSATEYKNIASDIFDSFNKIKPDWYTSSNRANLTSLNNCSSDFNKLIDINCSLIRKTIPTSGNINTSVLSNLDKTLVISSIVNKNNNLISSPKDQLKKSFPYI